MLIPSLAIVENDIVTRLIGGILIYSHQILLFVPTVRLNIFINLTHIYFSIASATAKIDPL